MLADESIISRIVHYVSGTDQVIRSEETHLSERVASEKARSLVESTTSYYICNIAALLLDTVSIFIHVYWSTDWRPNANSLSEI